MPPACPYSEGGYLHLGQSFTYERPQTMWHYVKSGCRVLVPFKGSQVAFRTEV